MLPHADLVVCLDGNGGIAAVCAPSDLSAALKHSMQEAAKKNSTDSLSNSTGSISSSSSSGTDSEITYSTAVIADPSSENSKTHHKLNSNTNTNTNRDVANNMKKLTRSESNGFFDLLSA